MKALAAYIRIVDWITERIGSLSIYLVIIVVATGFINVVLRYVGGAIGQKLTSNALIEIQWYLYSLIFIFGFAYILKNNINVRVDFWYANWSEKTQAWVNLVGHVLALIPFTLIGIWVSWAPILRSWGLQANGTWGPWEMSSDAEGLPRAPIKTMILVAFILLLIQGIAEILKYAFVLADKKELLPGHVPEKPEAPLRIE